MGMLQEFRQFAMKGNVMDLAVGVIIGGAFGKIIDSVVNDLIMPVVGKIFGGMDFSNYFIGLQNYAEQAKVPLAEAKKIGAVLAYGNFITILINFILLAFVIFLLVKRMSKWQSMFAPPPAPPAPPPPSEIYLKEIRDALTKR